MPKNTLEQKLHLGRNQATVDKDIILQSVAVNQATGVVSFGLSTSINNTCLSYSVVYKGGSYDSNLSNRNLNSFVSESPTDKSYEIKNRPDTDRANCRVIEATLRPGTDAIRIDIGGKTYIINREEILAAKKAEELSPSAADSAASTTPASPSSSLPQGLKTIPPNPSGTIGNLPPLVEPPVRPIPPLPSNSANGGSSPVGPMPPLPSNSANADSSPVGPMPPLPSPSANEGSSSVGPMPPLPSNSANGGSSPVGPMPPLPSTNTNGTLPPLPSANMPHHYTQRYIQQINELYTQVHDSRGKSIDDVIGTVQALSSEERGKIDDIYKAIERNENGRSFMEDFIRTRSRITPDQIEKLVKLTTEYHSSASTLAKNLYVELDSTFDANNETLLKMIVDQPRSGIEAAKLFSETYGHKYYEGEEKSSLVDALKAELTTTFGDSLQYDSIAHLVEEPSKWSAEAYAKQLYDCFDYFNNYELFVSMITALKGDDQKLQGVYEQFNTLSGSSLSDFVSDSNFSQSQLDKMAEVGVGTRPLAPMGEL